MLMRKWIWPAVAGIILAGIGVLVWQLDIPNWKKLDLERVQARPESTMVFAADGSAVGTIYPEQVRIHAPLEEIPDLVVQAFLTAEDQRFFEHNGVDFRRILGALWHDIKTRSLEQGASTITQQLIKLTHLTGEKTLSRKVQEAMLAMRLERRMDKNEILQAYLNTVYFGSGAYGIGSAAKAYFGKDAANLSLAEGALLAGIIKSPSSYAPHLQPENALRRRNLILNRMHEEGLVSADELQQAKAEPVSILPQEDAVARYGWYMDQVMTEAEEILRMEPEEILSAGLHIYTALDMRMQDSTDKLFENGANFPDPASDGTPVQAAAITMNTKNGEIAAVVGGREYQVRRGLNRAMQIQRQPGSAIKPISSYAAAIEKHDFLPVSMIQDVQREFPGKYLPGNVSGIYYGTVTLREALARSLNVATVDLADLIGMQSVRSTIADFGIPLAAQDVNLSLSLGSMTYGVSPAQLCAAYCALGNGGTQVNAHAIRRITSASGKLLYEATVSREEAVSPETAFLVTDMLKTAASTGSAKALAAAGIPVAGKTGTVGEAGGGNRDIWTVGYTPDMAVAVWMGFDEPDAEHAMPDYAGGSSYPAALCAAILKNAPGSGSDFLPPDGLVPLRIDAKALNRNDVVQLAAVNTPEEYVQIEWFRKHQQPEMVSTLWDVPQMVDDLKLLPVEGDHPALAFTAKDATAEYLILRKSGEASEIAAVVRGEPGSIIVWSDPEETDKDCSYSVLPRHGLLYESGTLVTALESEPVQWRGGSLMDRLFG